MSTTNHTIKVNIEDGRALITLPNDVVFEAELNDGETDEQFMARLEGIIRQTYGDKLKSLSVTGGAA